MKKHILSLFDRVNRLWTIAFLTASLLLIILALSLGMENNLTVNLMFVCGMGFLYMAFIHIWRSAMNYIYLLVTALFTYILFLLVTIIISNINVGPEQIGPSKIQVFVGALYTIIGLSVCLPGIVIGLLGSVILGLKEYRVRKSTQ